VYDFSPPTFVIFFLSQFAIPQWTGENSTTGSKSWNAQTICINEQYRTKQQVRNLHSKTPPPLSQPKILLQHVPFRTYPKFTETRWPWHQRDESTVTVRFSFHFYVFHPAAHKLHQVWQEEYSVKRNT
jgi:hypothetical protein